MEFFKKEFGNLRVENFIERVCIDFELELERTVRELGENPLCYREKTMSSFLFPALQNNSVRTLMEIYYHNGHRNYLDFYSLDKTRECCYLIEFKHRFWGSNQKEFDKRDLLKWDEVNEQINKLEKETVNEYIDSQKTIYGISFYMLTVIMPKEKSNEEIRESMIEKIQKCIPNYDWGWIYELPEILNYQDKEDNQFYKYSHIIFLGKVRKIDE